MLRKKKIKEVKSRGTASIEMALLSLRFLLRPNVGELNRKVGKLEMEVRGFDRRVIQYEKQIKGLYRKKQLDKHLFSIIGTWASQYSNALTKREEYFIARNKLLSRLSKFRQYNPTVIVNINAMIEREIEVNNSKLEETGKLKKAIEEIRTQLKAASKEPELPKKGRQLAKLFSDAERHFFHQNPHPPPSIQKPNL